MSFYRNWNPNRSPSQRLRQSEVERLKSTLANEFRTVFSETLTRGGYQLVGRTYVANTGQMTLVAELRDSVTGQLLARVVDTVRGRRTGQFQLASSVRNMADARRALSQWADMLLTGLQDAEGRTPTAGPSS